MRRIPTKLSADHTSALSAFLGSPDRPDDTLTFHELQGFLFAIACAPETIPPSEWLPVISNDEDIGYRTQTEAEQVLNQIMTLYNEINSSVLERSDAMPSGCKFDADLEINFDEKASVSQWSSGFAVGHDWLSDLWDEYVPEALDEECGVSVMALSFFSSRQLAEAYYSETVPGKRRTKRRTFEQFAETMREFFPSALSSYAHLGRSIFEALIEKGSDRH